MHSNIRWAVMVNQVKDSRDAKRETNRESRGPEREIDKSRGRRGPERETNKDSRGAERETKRQRGQRESLKRQESERD